MAKKHPKTPPAPASTPNIPPAPRSMVIWLVAIPMFVLLGGYSMRFLDAVLMPKYLGWAAISFVVLAGAILRPQPLENLWNWLKAVPFWAVYGLYLAASGVSLAQTDLWGDGIFEVSKVFLGLLWAIIWTRSFQTDSRYAIGVSRMISLFLFCIACVGLYQLLALLPKGNLNHTQLYTVNGGLGHRNIFSEVLFLCFPFALFGAIHDTKSLAKLHLAISILGGGLMIGLLSRSIWVTTAITSIVMGGIYVWKEIFIWTPQAVRKAKILQAAKWGGIGAGILILTLTLYGYIDSFDTLTKQIDSIIHPQYYSNHDRLQKWQQSYELFKQHPITGIGPGDWKVEILQFPAHNSETEFGRLTFQRPHNDYLWILSESGLVTFLFYILLFLISFYALLSLLSKVEDKKTRDWLYCMGIGLVGYSLFSNFGFPKERIETTVLLHILFAGVWAEKYAHRTIAKDSLPIGKFLLILAGLLVGGCLYVGWERAEAERLLRQYEVTKKQHKTPQALALAQQALRPLYQMDPTSIPLPYFSGTCYLELQKLKEAERDLLHALRISPYHIQSMNNLGGCYFQMGKKEKADSMFSRAIHYAPRFEDALMSMAVVEYGKGKVANAVNALTYMCNIDSASTTPKYRSQIQIISDSVSTYLCKSISEPYFQDEIRATLKDRHRYLSIHYRSKGKRPFLTQLYSEALFGLYSSKKITQAEWDSLQVKYKCKILPESK